MVKSIFPSVKNTLKLLCDPDWLTLLRPGDHHKMKLIDLKRAGTVFWGAWGGFRNKPSDGDASNFSLVYTNNDLLRITKCQPLWDFINTQYLKYVAHACRRPNTNLTKLSLFMIPKTPYYRDPWIKVSKLLGGITIEQAKRETQSKTGFLRLLHLKYTPEEL